MALQSVYTSTSVAPPSSSKDAQLNTRLTGLEIKHRRLDASIAVMEAEVNPDALKISEAKRKRLAIRDKISVLRKKLGLPALH